MPRIPYKASVLVAQKVPDLQGASVGVLHKTALSAQRKERADSHCVVAIFRPVLVPFVMGGIWMWGLVAEGALMNTGQIWGRGQRMTLSWRRDLATF